MKALFLLTVLISTSFATSYWYDYCDVVEPAKEFLLKNRPGQSFDEAKKCSDYNDRIEGDHWCSQLIMRGSWLRFGRNRMGYDVEIRTEQDYIYKMKVIMKDSFDASANRNCRPVKMKIVSRRKV